MWSRNRRSAVWSSSGMYRVKSALCRYVVNDETLLGAISVLAFELCTKLSRLIVVVLGFLQVSTAMQKQVSRESDLNGLSSVSWLEQMGRKLGWSLGQA